VCPGCGEAVVPPAVIALDAVWHSTCFACLACGDPLAGKPGGAMIVPAADGDGDDVYCAPCHERLFAVVCGGCNEIITEGRAIKPGALGDVHFHEDCFRCGDCREPLAGGKYFPVEEIPYCEDCFTDSRAVVCDACFGYISGAVLSVAGKTYHPTGCFACSDCGIDLSTREFSVNIAGKAFCEVHGETGGGGGAGAQPAGAGSTPGTEGGEQQAEPQGPGAEEAREPSETGKTADVQAAAQAPALPPREEAECTNASAVIVDDTDAPVTDNATGEASSTATPAPLDNVGRGSISRLGDPWWVLFFVCFCLSVLCLKKVFFSNF
jgi:uncharacterized CHY-type Zn-finger protein